MSDEERARLQAVDALAIIGTPPEDRFDRIARLAAELLETPIALVSIVGRDTQFFKASHGLDIRETPREHSFCTHTIRDPTPLVIPDATCNPLFAENPLVTGAPGIRFYAGAPIQSRSGHRVGTLCVIDRKPRDIDPARLQMLEDLARITSDALELREANDALRRRANDLRHHLHQTRRVLDEIFAFVGVLDLDGTLVEANRAPIDAAGIEYVDVIGKPFWDCYWWNFSPDSMQRLQSAVRRAAAGERLRYDAEIRIEHGVSATIDFMMAPLRDDAGVTTHLICSGVDVSTRVATERQLGALARIVEAAPDFVSIARIDGTIRFINPAGRTMLGLAEDADISHLTLSDCHPPWADARVRELGIPASLRSGTWRGETALKGEGGREIAVSQVVVALPDDIGGCSEIATIARDVSITRRYVDALKDREGELRDTFENAAVGIVRIGVDGNILRVNTTLCDLLGYRVRELVGRPIADLLSPDDIAASRRHRDALVSGDGDSFNAEVRLLRKDGTPIWVSETATLSSVREDDRPYVISIFQDIRERKQFEEQQRLLIGELNHRVKNTLATIQSIANQTHRRTRDPAQFVERFNGRLRALASAHGILTSSSWRGASVRKLVADQVSLGDPQTSERIRTSGPDLLLEPQVAVNLGLVLHELATNAMKHGALSNSEGSVALTWQIAAIGDDTPERQLILRWIEEGGPRVAPPTRTGFGRSMIERSLTHGMRGDVALMFDPRGVVCEIKLPLRTPIDPIAGGSR